MGTPFLFHRHYICLRCYAFQVARLGLQALLGVYPTHQVEYKTAIARVAMGYTHIMLIACIYYLQHTCILVIIN